MLKNLQATPAIAAVRRDLRYRSGRDHRGTVWARRLRLCCALLLGGLALSCAPDSPAPPVRVEPALPVEVQRQPKPFDVDVLVNDDPKELVRLLSGSVAISLEATGIRLVAVPRHPVLVALDLRAGDLLTTIGGIPPISAQSAIAIQALLAGSGPIEFTLVRDGRVRRHRVRRGVQPVATTPGEGERHGQ